MSEPRQPIVIVCRPASFPVRRITRCPTCKRRRRFSGLDQVWYGVRWTCCACGDSFGDGERLMRPARRGWRVEAAAKAKEVWVEAGKFTAEQRAAWIHEQIHGPEVD